MFPPCMPPIMSIIRGQASTNAPRTNVDAQRDETDGQDGEGDGVQARWMPAKMEITKFDPKARKHVIYKETKIK